MSNSLEFENSLDSEKLVFYVKFLDIEYVLIRIMKTHTVKEIGVSSVFLND